MQVPAQLFHHMSTAATDSFWANTCAVDCRYGTAFGAVPTVIVSSQTDWYNPEDFTFERLRSIIGHKVVRDGDGEECSEEQKREGVWCHSIKEVDPRLMGKEWASLRTSNLTAIGVETYNDFMQVQVRIGSWKMLLFIGGGCRESITGPP
jgi:hypothetical protein